MTPYIIALWIIYAATFLTLLALYFFNKGRKVLRYFTASAKFVMLSLIALLIMALWIDGLLFQNLPELIKQIKE